MSNIGNILYQGVSSFGQNYAANKRWQAVQDAAQKEIDRQQKEQERELKQENDRLNAALKATGVSPAEIESMSIGEKRGTLQTMAQSGIRSYLGQLSQEADLARQAPGIAAPSAHRSREQLELNPTLAAQVDYFNRTNQIAPQGWAGMLAPESTSPNITPLPSGSHAVTHRGQLRIDPAPGANAAATTAAERLLARLKDPDISPEERQRIEFELGYYRFDDNYQQWVRAPIGGGAPRQPGPPPLAPTASGGGEANLNQFMGELGF